MENVKETELIITESYGDNCIVDKFQSEGGGFRRPAGKVEIWEEDEHGKKRLVRKSNLVIYLGREMLAQILVHEDNVDDLNNPRIVSDAKNHFLGWFGLGDGGVLPADPFDPVPPANENNDLNSNVMLTTSIDTSSGDYHVAGSGYPKTGYYKKLFDSIVFERDELNDNRWLVLKITTNIGIEYANDERLSEAGLFTATSRSGGWNGNFELFARVTFPTIIKDATRRLIFVWYLYV
jgi:hypothetical protein